MKDNQVLEYHEKQQFSSESLQQYDNEGQRYFLAYLLRKGYNLEIKESKIIFKDITSEEKVKEMIEHYNKIFFLKCDIRKYFQSIDHEVLLNLLKKINFSSDEMWMIEKLVKEQPNNADVCLPLGYRNFIIMESNMI